MPRPPRIERPVEKSLSLPQTLVAQVDLRLFSVVEGKLPHGAWRDYVVALIEADMVKWKAQQPVNINQEIARRNLGNG